MAVGSELLVAVLVDAVATFNPAIEVRTPGWYPAMPNIVGGQPLLDGCQGILLGLWQLVVDKLHAIVGLDGCKRKGWCKESRGMLQKVNGGCRIATRIQP